MIMKNKVTGKEALLRQHDLSYNVGRKLIVRQKHLQYIYLFKRTIHMTKIISNYPKLLLSQHT